MTYRKCWIPAAFVLAAALSLPAVTTRADSARHSSLESQIQLAASYYNSGRFREATQVLEKLVKQAPANFEAEELLGIAYSAESQDKDAYPHFAKAVKLNPGSAPARANLAVNL